MTVCTRHIWPVRGNAAHAANREIRDMQYIELVARGARPGKFLACGARASIDVNRMHIR